MPNNLTWRRCGNCGQLTLVPVSANVCWQCGAPCPDRESGHPAPADLNLPAPRPSFMALTPQDDAVARRLLASVFPDGVDV